MGPAPSSTINHVNPLSPVSDDLLAMDLVLVLPHSGNRCKWRVVTSDGQLIDQSGAMSGGGGGNNKVGGREPITIQLSGHGSW